MIQTRVETLDDLDWAEGRQVLAETERFLAVNGATYWLHLTHQHAAEFDADVARYTACGQKVARSRRTVAPVEPVEPKDETS